MSFEICQYPQIRSGLGRGLGFVSLLVRHQKLRASNNAYLLDWIHTPPDLALREIAEREFCSLISTPA